MDLDLFTESAYLLLLLADADLSFADPPLLRAHALDLDLDLADARLLEVDDWLLLDVAVVLARGERFKPLI